MTTINEIADVGIDLPNFGDSEIRCIKFRHPDLAIFIKLSDSERLCIIKCSRVKKVNFESDFMQNVIDNVELKLYSDHTHIECFHSKNGGYECFDLIINPVPGAGGKMRVLCEDVNVAYSLEEA